MLNESQKNILNIFMYFIVAILLIIRVDWWWYGAKIEPLVLGWLTYPMLYQLGIWLVGWLVVIVTCKYLWTEGDID